MERSSSPEASPAALSTTGAAGHILVDRELRAAVADSRTGAVRVPAGAPSIDAAQVQPASLDLRLGAVAYRIRSGFLPERTPVSERLAELATAELSLEGGGAVLERGLVYLVPIEEELQLAPDVWGRFNPRSSTGRCDVFTRVLVPGHPSFDETPLGYSGKLWLEVAPLSFPVRLSRGDRLSQLRLQRGVARLTRQELRVRYNETPLCYEGDRPLDEEEVRIDDDGGLLLRVGLAGREPCAWRAALGTDVVCFGADDAHPASDFWEPVHAKIDHCVLEPGRFYIFASRERIAVPPDLAAEMLPVDVGIGELRNNYAGFFDPGFGWRETGPCGTPAVLEVRAHDVPFLIEEGQVFFRLRFFRTSGRPDALYGEGRERSYGDQDLTLGRMFRGD